MSEVTCAVFEDAADELALGHSSEPRRAALLTHAASCARCGALLHDLSMTVDRLLEFAPAAEPPVGFETRALAAMGANDPPRTHRRRPRRLRVVGVVALCIALGVGIGVLTASRTAHPVDVAAPLINREGTTIGRAELYREDQARIVVVLETPKTWRGAWSCDLRREDGSWATVGTWTAAEAPSGAWTAVVSTDLAGSSAMRIRAADGTVVATARFA